MMYFHAFAIIVVAIIIFALVIEFVEWIIWETPRWRQRRRDRKHFKNTERFRRGIR